MENETSSPIANVASQFLAAIQEDNLPALKALVQLHGTETRLVYSAVKKDPIGNDVSSSVNGTALSIAVFLKKEALAVYLVQAGALQVPATVVREGWFGWDEAVTVPIEPATSFRMRELTLALMQAEAPVNWSFCPRYDDDSMCASQSAPSLFEYLTESQELVGFIGTLGLFRGAVKGHLVEVSPSAGGLHVSLDGLAIGFKDSMQASLDLVREQLNFEPYAMRSFEDQDNEPAYEGDAAHA